MDEQYTLISYNPERIESYCSDSLDDILAKVREDCISWVIFRSDNASGVEEIQKLLSTFVHLYQPGVCDEI